jgi:hypothetical protein
MPLLILSPPDSHSCSRKVWGSAVPRLECYSSPTFSGCTPTCPTKPSSVQWPFTLHCHVTSFSLLCSPLSLCSSLHTSWVGARGGRNLSGLAHSCLWLPSNNPGQYHLLDSVQKIRCSGVQPRVGLGYVLGVATLSWEGQLHLSQPRSVYLGTSPSGPQGDPASTPRTQAC